MKLNERVHILENALFEANEESDLSKTIMSPTWLQLITPNSKHSALNAIFRSVLSENELEKQIEQVTGLYRQMDTPFRWLVTPLTQPASTPDKLKQKGFHLLYEAEAMIIECEKAITEYSREIEVRKVSRSDLDLYVDVFAGAWGLSTEQKQEYKTSVAAALVKHSNYHPFLALSDGKAVGSSALVEVSAGGYIVAGAVVEESRGQGIYRAMVSERAKIALELGHKHLMIHAKKETAAPICRKLGFEWVYDYQVYEYRHTS